MSEFIAEFARKLEFIFEPPTNLILGALFSLVAVGAAYRGVQLFIQGLRNSRHPSGALWLVRGIRSGIVALASGMFVVGVLYAKWLMIFGVIFLGEELYETGVVILGLRSGQRAARKSSSHGIQRSRETLPANSPNGSRTVNSRSVESRCAGSQP